jgi:hypothetical protein
MFGIFKSRKVEPDLSGPLSLIIQQASISPIFRESSADFSIRLNVDSETISRHIGFKGAPQMVVAMIEKRILGSDFERHDFDFDRSPPNANDPQIANGRIHGMRIMVDCNLQPLLHWQGNRTDS